MNNGSCIIDAIIGEAQAAAEANIASATARAKEVTNAAQSKIDAEIAELKGRRQEIAEEIVKRKAMVANIDAKKQKLNAKMRLIDDVFAYAPKAVKSDKRYSEYLKRLISDNAENGDTLIVSKADRSIVDKAFLDALAKQKGVKLRLSDENGDFTGGVIITNDGYDKNLTLESVVEQMRNEIEMETARILFGE